jgi:hypothetical protein
MRPTHRHTFLDRLRTSVWPRLAHGSPPTPHGPSDVRLVATSQPSPALSGDCVAGAAASLVGSGTESLCSALSWPRCALQTALGPASQLAGGALGHSAHASGAPPSILACAPRDAPRIFAKSVGQRCVRARSSAAEDGGARDDNFFNFFSQLLPRHALQVSIDKERATPPRPLKRKPITAIREAAAPASALPARYNPGYLSLWPGTALNYTREMCGGLRRVSLLVES